MKKVLKKAVPVVGILIGLHDRITGNISGLSGNISGDLYGDISGLTGDISGLSGNIDDAGIMDDERVNGIDILDLIDSD